MSFPIPSIHQQGYGLNDNPEILNLDSLGDRHLVFQDLLLLEEQEGSVNFKFGVLYTRPGQNTDDEMFSNGE
jgi:hypothetical protein